MKSFLIAFCMLNYIVFKPDKLSHTKFCSNSSFQPKFYSRSHSCCQKLMTKFHYQCAKYYFPSEKKGEIPVPILPLQYFFLRNVLLICCSEIFNDEYHKSHKMDCNCMAVCFVFCLFTFDGSSPLRDLHVHLEEVTFSFCNKPVSL